MVKRFNFNSVIEHLIHFPSELLLVLSAERENAQLLTHIHLVGTRNIDLERSAACGVWQPSSVKC